MPAKAKESSSMFDGVERWETVIDKYIDAEGNYVCEITEAKDGTAKYKPSPCIRSPRFVDTQGRGSIRHWDYYNENHLGKVANLFDVAGVPAPVDGEFDPVRPHA